MTGIIKAVNSAKKIKIQELNKVQQAKLVQYAQMDILKDEAKKIILANDVNITALFGEFVGRQTPNTQTAYRIGFRAFSDFCTLSGINPLLITAREVDRFIDHLALSYKPNSIRAKVASVSSFYKTLYRYGHIDTNQFLGAKMPKKEYKKRVDLKKGSSPIMSDNDYMAIVKKVHQLIDTYDSKKGKMESIKMMNMCHLAYAIELMATYGLRVGSVETAYIANNSLKWDAKGGKCMSVELTQDEIQHLDFINTKFFKSIKTSTIKNTMKKVVDMMIKEGTLPHAYTPHDFRHYFAIKYYQKTKDIVGLKNKLGHASINVTDVYLQGLGAI